MGIFGVTILVLIVLIWLWLKLESGFFGVAAIIAVIVLCCECVVAFDANIGAEARVASCRQRYNALIYKVESGACVDEFGLLNKEIIDEIQYWNENLAYRKEMQRDRWYGAFYPNVYDEFETIEYTRYQ